LQELGLVLVGIEITFIACIPLCDGVDEGRLRDAGNDLGELLSGWTGVERSNEVEGEGPFVCRDNLVGKYTREHLADSKGKPERPGAVNESRVPVPAEVGDGGGQSRGREHAVLIFMGYYEGGVAQCGEQGLKGAPGLLFCFDQQDGIWWNVLASPKGTFLGLFDIVHKSLWPLAREGLV